jgi:hypothetical protein
VAHPHPVVEGPPLAAGAVGVARRPSRALLHLLQHLLLNVLLNQLPLVVAAEEAATVVPSLRPLRVVTVAVAAIRRPLQLPDRLQLPLAEGAVGVVLLRHSPAAAMVVVAEDRQVRQHPLPHR